MKKSELRQIIREEIVKALPLTHFLKEGKVKEFYMNLQPYGSEEEIAQYMESLSKSMELGDKNQYEGWTDEDYIEDFKNYIADKSL